MRLRGLVISGLVIAFLLIPLIGFSSVQASDQACFTQTQQCVSGRIREFWEQNGGLMVFGYPVTGQYEASIEGKPLQVQWFERARLELHPENARPYDVLLGRLGVDRLIQQNRDWFTFPRSGNQAGCRYFPETDQSICGEILQAWHANGLEIDGRPGKTEAENLALFGLPISPPQSETLGDGRQYTVQWFERARFESHPENQAPYTVLLGLLGTELYGPGMPAQPAQSAVPEATQPPPAPTRIPPTVVPPTEVPHQSSSGNCDPAYPDVCIPSPPPDLDCGDIPYRNFRVIGSDPPALTVITMVLAVRSIDRSS